MILLFCFSNFLCAANYLFLQSLMGNDVSVLLCISNTEVAFSILGIKICEHASNEYLVQLYFYGYTEKSSSVVSILKCATMQ